MVPLTRLNGGTLHLSADLIATVEEHHDTVVTLVDGKCLVVAESAEQVVAALVLHRAEILATAERLLTLPSLHASRMHLRPDVRGEQHATDADELEGVHVARVLALRPGAE